ncbi:hypothetical protein ACLOJK_040961 [Asimina triloba]
MNEFRSPDTVIAVDLLLLDSMVVMGRGKAHFYNIHDLLVTSLSNPSHFDAFNLEKSSILPLNNRDSPSAIATTKYGSVHVAHDSKITSFDWSLRHKSTILTQFAAVDSLLSLSPSVTAAGATDFPGLQILDLNDGSMKQTLSWENPTRSSSTVQAIGASPKKRIEEGDGAAIRAKKVEDFWKEATLLSFTIQMWCNFLELAQIDHLIA